MFRRTLTVVYKPAKTNYAILSDAYFKLVNTYDRGCLNLTFNNQCHFVSWAPYGANIKEYEIGLNATVAQSLGLKEGALIKCSLVSDVMSLDSVTATVTTHKDWELLEMSSNRIQSTLLNQTRIINEDQKLVVWINASIYLTLKIEKLSPNVTFGRLENDTEIVISPFKKELEKVLPTYKPAAMNTNYKLSHCQSEMFPLRGNSTKTDDKRATMKKELEEMSKILKKEAPKSYEFRIITSKWENGQIADLHVDCANEIDDFDCNQIFVLTTNSDKEYFVNVKTLNKNTHFPKTIYPSIEMSDILMNILKIDPFEKVTIKPKNSVLNFVDKIELVPNQQVAYRVLKEIEEEFKKFIIDNSKLFPVLINQHQIFKLKNNNIYITINLYPENFKFCVVDASVLKEARIQAIDKFKDIDDLLNPPKKEEELIYNEENLVKICKFDIIAEEIMDRIKIAMCLDERNKVRSVENIILVGNYNAGKTTICSKVLHELSIPPYNCYFDIFYGSRNKGRKPESIQKDLRAILTTCIKFNPSILLLDNLDFLTHASNEHNQDTEYFNRISDIIHSLILEFTPNSAISIIATVSNISNLNKRIYTSRGRHLFQHNITIPNLEANDREFIIKELCRNSTIAKILNWKRFSNLTEGYKIGDLVQFAERALFYAFRENPKSPVLTDEIFLKSLETTNSYCLQGIENYQKIDEEEEDIVRLNDIAGMESVVEVLEEVLVWPTKYPKIFENPPLRNQAGVLLFGPPGTGKTYLVLQMAKSWNLRMISVKGPELLAKFIGQSEENVRNLFNKARSAKPCVLFFDEFDSLAPRRGHDSTGVTDRVVNQLLTELDGVESLNGVTVIAATSRPELLDPALLRSGRLDRLVECTVPNKEARESIFENLSLSLNLDDDVDFTYFLDKTENFTGADIQSILTTANMSAVKEVIAKDPENIPDTVTITQRHLIDAFNNTRPSLSAIDIEKYKILYSRFTNKENKTDFNFVAKRATLA